MALQDEAFAYWTLAQRVRMSRRRGRLCDEAEDDLAVIFIYSRHPVVVRDCERLLGIERKEVG